MYHWAAQWGGEACSHLHLGITVVPGPAKEQSLQEEPVGWGYRDGSVVKNPPDSEGPTLSSSSSSTNTHRHTEIKIILRTQCGWLQSSHSFSFPRLSLIKDVWPPTQEPRREIGRFTSPVVPNQWSIQGCAFPTLPVRNPKAHLAFSCLLNSLIILIYSLITSFSPKAPPVGLTSW